MRIATQQAVDEAALNAECDGWQGAFASPKYLVSLITVTDKSGGGASAIASAWTVPTSPLSCIFRVS